MVRIIAISLMLGVSAVVTSQESISSGFKLKWKSEIGITTYRTNIIETDGKIYVGSNGKDANGDNDSKDGVYEIDAKSGKVTYQFSLPFLGDNDVTGIAQDGSHLYFGSDNYYFYCFDTQTHQELWKYPTPYDVESVPVLVDLNDDGIKDVFFSVQNHGFYALNGTSGLLLWKQDSISSHQGNVAALAVDCNDDGVLDFVTGANGTPYTNELDGWKMKHYGDYHLALDGKTGQVLWASATGAGIHPSPFLYVDEFGESMICAFDCYGEMQFLTLKGEKKKVTGFGYGFFMSPVIHQNQLVVGDYVMQIADSVFDVSRDGNYKYLTNRSQGNEATIKGTISATSMVADILNLGSPQVIVLSESGEMNIRDMEGKLLKTCTFPKGAEASIFIKDVDNDGLLELLIASLDGYLYCYDTKSKGQVIYGQFRWTNSNTPVSEK